MSSGLQRRGGSSERRAVRTPLKSVTSGIVVLAVLLGMGTLGSLVSLASGTASGLGLGQAWINICKASTVTGTYQFSLDSGPAISIAAGKCDLIEVEDGHNTVTELPDMTGATQLSGISVSPPVDTVAGTLSLPNRTVTVNIPANQTATTTFTNVYVAQIQVCKIAGTPSLVGDPFNFTYSGGVPTTTPFTVDAGTASAPICSTPVSYPAGSSVTTTEVSIPSGVQVSPPIVTSSPSSGSCTTDVSAGTATCSLGTSGGLTTVTYTDVEEPQIEVCKIAGTASLVGDPFDFTYSGGVPTTTPFTVDAGTASAPICSTPVSYPAGSSVTTTEVSIPSGVQVSPPIVTSSPSSGSCTTDVSAGTATCSLGTSGGLTTVTYTDVEEPQIEVCKIAGTASLVGDPFDFTYSGGVPTTTPFTVDAGTPSAPVCSTPAVYASGSSVTTTEVSIPTGVQVSSITPSSPSSGSCTTVVSAGTATCSLGTTGLTTVTYTDVVEPAPKPQIQVCKIAGTASLVGDRFDFTYSGGVPTTPRFKVRAGTASAPVCSTPVSYASGSSVTTTEVSIPTGVQVSSITPSSPSSGSCTTVVSAGTATCSLGTTGLTTVTYTDVVVPHKPQIQVCKIAGTSSLVGDRFDFTYSGGVPTTPRFKVRAGTASAPVCSTPVSYASGSSVTTTEVSIPTGVQVSSITPSSPSSGSCTTVVSAGTATCSLGTTGLTTVTYTDVQTQGWIEVCKVAGDPSVDGHSFSFSVNGAAAFSVMAGNCSNPIEVPTGTATVDEIQSNPDFYLKSVSTVTATDPTGARLLSAPTQDPAMVSVPGGGVANETVVTFTNDTAQATFKICTAQTSPGANLVGVPMTYAYTYTVNGTATTGSVTLDTPLVSSVCSLPIGPFNVVNDDGSSVAVSVTAEVPPVTAVDLADFLYQGDGSITSEPAFPSSFPATVSIAVGPGANVMTFTDGAAH